MIIPAALSPIIAALVAALGTWLLYRISRSLTRGARNHGFRIGQVGSACMVSLAHGTNDAQKTMGVITLALIANGTLPPALSRGFTNMALPPFLTSVIQWLRAGYPEGVPDVDYVPLFALLGSQLSESDVKAIAEELENVSKPESAEAIRKAITMVTDHAASDADVARVRSRLAAGGWPLAKPEHFDPANWP